MPDWHSLDACVCIVWGPRVQPWGQVGTGLLACRWPRAVPWARLTQGCLHGPLQAALLEASWTNLLLLVQLLFITLLLRHKACYTIQLYPVAKLLLLPLHSDCFT